MNTQKLAEIVAKEYNMPEAEKYDLSLREFDNMIEVIGYVNDPNYEITDTPDHLPKCWVTLGVLPASTRMNING